MKNTKIKSILLILGTLVIGFVIGFLVSGRLTHQRIRKMVEMRRSKGFQKEMVAVIEPTEAQATLINPILDSFGERLDSMHSRHLVEMQENMALLELSLEPYLEPIQMDKLKKRLKRMEGRAKRGHRNHPRRGKPDRPAIHKWPARDQD